MTLNPITLPVIPTIKSQGGPFDDASYYAGIEMGLLESQLLQIAGLYGPDIHAVFHIRKENQPMADLLAMKNRFNVRWRDCPEHPTHLEMLAVGDYLTEENIHEAD